MSDKKYVVYYHEKVNEYFYDYYSRFNMNEQYSKPVLYSDDFKLIERAKNDSMNDYKNKAIILHAEVYGWLYRALDEMVKAEWHNDELFKVWLGRAEFLVRQSKKLHAACENDYSKRALIRALQLKVEINKKISSNTWQR